MSISQLEAELTTLQSAEFDALEAAFRRERVRRNGHTLSEQETRLFAIINEPLPGIEELPPLRLKRDELTLTEKEHAKLIELEDAREIAWAHKLQAVSDLADVRGEDFQRLYKSLELTLRNES
jgi:hypothetical protein